MKRESVVRHLVKNLLCCSALLAGVWAAQPAQSAPISGSFSMSGGWIPIGGTGSIATATGLDFIPNPGVSTGQFAITAPGGSGSFSSLTPGELGTVKDFVFSPFAAPIANFISIGGFTLDLESTHVVMQNGNFLLLDGAVDVSGNGLTDQSAVFLLASTGIGTTFSWTATAGFQDTTGTGNGGGTGSGDDGNGNGNTNGNGTGGTPPTQVPEPMSLAMLGFGLLGYGIMRRRAKH
jgi:hypothetical protein